MFREKKLFSHLPENKHLNLADLPISPMIGDGVEYCSTGAVCFVTPTKAKRLKKLFCWGLN